MATATAAGSTTTSAGAVHDRIQDRPVAATGSIAVAGYGVVVTAFVAFGLMLTHWMGPLTRWDTHVNQWFADHRSGVLDTMTTGLTKMADTLGIILVLVMAIVVLVAIGRRWEALLVALAVALELATFLTVNYLVDRPRPDVVRLGSLPSTSSFPSGHTAVVVALYGGLAVITGRRVRAVLVVVLAWSVVALAAVAVGFARVYRGMHHPSDVIAGALLGLAVLGVAVLATRRGEAASTPAESDKPEGVTS